MAGRDENSGIQVFQGGNSAVRIPGFQVAARIKGIIDMTCKDIFEINGHLTQVLPRTLTTWQPLVQGQLQVIVSKQKLVFFYVFPDS